MSVYVKNRQNEDEFDIINTRFFLQVGMYGTAEVSLMRNTKICPRDPWIWTEWGNFHMIRNEPEEAKTCYDKAIHLSAECYEAWKRKLVLCHTQNDFSEALECLRNMIKIKCPDEYSAQIKKFGSAYLCSLSNFGQLVDVARSLDSSIAKRWGESATHKDKTLAT